MKSNIIKVFCLAALMFGIGSSVNAQFRQSVFLNGGIPTGQFAKAVNDNHTTVPLYHTDIAKAATPGFGLGYRVSYRFDVGVGEVAPFANVDLFWNFMGDGWSDTYIQAHSSAPNYFNIPLVLGVSYFYDELWNDITPYGEFGVGADLFIIGSEKSEYFVHKYAYKPTISMAWMIGAGAYFGRHVSAGIYYYGLGKHTIEYTSKTVSDFTTVEQVAYEGSDVETRTLGQLALRIGFHF